MYAADVTVQDSILYFLMVKAKLYSNLSINLPVSDTQMAAWAVHPDNEILAAILEQYLYYTKEAGIWEDYWQDSYGTTYFEYLQLIGL